jgi:hypothetical protein
MTKRRYVCESGFTSKRDANAEAAIIRKSIDLKATVKPDGSGGYKVCRTYKRKRR